MAMLTTTLGSAVGAGATLAIRQQLDQQGSRAITRPSVIYGVGLGLAGIGATMAVNRRLFNPPVFSRREFNDLAMTVGTAAAATGIASAFLPKGVTGATIPALG